MAKIQVAGASQRCHFAVGTTDIDNPDARMAGQVVIDQVVHQKTFTGTTGGTDQGVMVIGGGIEEIDATEIPFTAAEK